MDGQLNLVSALAAGRDDGLELSSDPGRLQVDRIVEWLGSSYWAASRPRSVIEASLRGSLGIGVYAPAESSGSEASSVQVAFARVITDSATFAWIADVFVDPAWRGRRIGHWLVGSAVEHLQGLGVPRILLATRDAHGVYADLGFEALRVPETWMEIDARPDRPNPGDVRPDRPNPGDVRR